MGFFALLSGRAWAGIGLAIAVAIAIGGAYLAVDSRGYSRCTAERDLADYQIAEEAHQFMLAEAARGDAIGVELAKTQRRLNETKTEYMAYANGIVGNCPADLGLFLAAEEATLSGLPTTTGAPTGSAPSVEASEIAANIAENRWRFELNRAQCAALLEWHGKEALK